MTRRALARSSLMEMAAVSSMTSWEAPTSLTACLKCFISSWVRLPLLMISRLRTPERAKRRRSTIWTAGISQEKSRVGFFSLSAMCSMMLSRKEVLPMEGRAAMMNMSPGLSPLLFLSSSSNPVVSPWIWPLLAINFSKLVTACLRMLARLCSSLALL